MQNFLSRQVTSGYDTKKITRNDSLNQSKSSSPNKFQARLKQHLKNAYLSQPMTPDQKKTVMSTAISSTGQPEGPLESKFTLTQPKKANFLLDLKTVQSIKRERAQTAQPKRSEDSRSSFNTTGPRGDASAK